MAKTIITAALTGAVTPAGYKIPETPQQIADEAYDAWKLGAAVVHLHMRAPDGLGAMDQERFRETIRRIRAHEDCDIIINCTSSGASKAHPATDEERMAHHRELPGIEMGSYDAGTFNWMPAGVFLNTPQFLEKLGDLYGYIEEMVNGQKEVKVFCHEQKAQEGFDRVNDALFESADMANKYANILMPIMVNIGNIQYVIVAMAGGLMALGGVGGGVTLGVIASFLQLSKSFSQPISQISQQLNSVVMALAGAGRIFALMDEESERDEGTVTLVNAAYDQAGELGESGQRTNLWAWKVPQKEGGFAYTRLTGDVRFFDVDFEYEAGKPILHDISLFAKPGQKLAFVGATGAGKTTITNLINRFYDIADGKIRYDGININKIRKSDLRRSLGIVLQETNLFTGTVRENIRYGNLQATDEEVEAAAQLAGADDFIRRLPQGYDTLLTGNGANLSQGQRQLLAIARCAVADPPVMILDEATSSIDTRTESIVQQGMDSLMCGRTVFVIAHRLSTVRNSDAIMVLDHGRIVERGGHDDLIAQHGLYYQLYTGAFELE